MICKNHKKVSPFLKSIEHILSLASPITTCVSIVLFASFFDIPIGMISSAIGLKICTITVGVKKNRSIIKKKKKNHNKIVFLAKTSLNSILISKVFTGSYNSHDESVLVNNVLKEYDERRNQKFTDLKCQLKILIFL